MSSVKFTGEELEDIPEAENVFEFPQEMPAHDSPDWRVIRDRKLEEWLPDAAARSFVVHVSNFYEMIDDIVDGDEVSNDQAISSLLAVMIDLPSNRFFEAYKHQLIPVLLTGINAWLDSVDMEKNSGNDRIAAYTLRLQCADMIAFSAFLLYGFEHMRRVSREVRRLLMDSEPFEVYEKELADRFRGRN